MFGGHSMVLLSLSKHSMYAVAAIFGGASGTSQAMVTFSDTTRRGIAARGTASDAGPDASGVLGGGIVDWPAPMLFCF